MLFQIWLAANIYTGLVGRVFFNPFTKSIIQLPVLAVPYSSVLSSLVFSAPPTSPDCIVVELALNCEGKVCHFSREIGMDYN